MFRYIHLLILSLIFIGCTKELDYNTLTISYSADIRGFDPAFATDLRTGKVISLVYDNLVRFDAEMNLVPALAKSWSLSKTSTKYTFNIRQDVRFHDNTPLTINDIVKSFQRVLASSTASPQTWLLERISGARDYMQGARNHVQGLKIIDDSN